MKSFTIVLIAVIGAVFAGAGIFQNCNEKPKAFLDDERCKPPGTCIGNTCVRITWVSFECDPGWWECDEYGGTIIATYTQFLCTPTMGGACKCDWESQEPSTEWTAPVFTRYCQ